MAVTSGALKGKYVLVSSGIEKNLFVRIGDGPAGPFGDRHDIYAAPEWDTAAPRIYTYNAKAHPSLSSNGDWLVTYNVNTPDWDRNLADADIYHPRFVKLRFDPASALRPRVMIGAAPKPARGFGWDGWGIPVFGGKAGAGGIGHRADGRERPLPLRVTP
jgi:hypothetical protein